MNIAEKERVSTDKPAPHSLAKAASIVASATAFSRLTGLVREQIVAFYFGASLAADAFFTAFRIPNLLRDLFAEGALSSAFVPVFKERLVKNGKEEAFALADVVMSWLLVAVGLVTLVGVLVTPFIVYITAHGFTDVPEKFQLTVVLTRIMWPFLILVSLGAMIMGMLNSFGKFGVAALASSMFNVGSILSIILLYSVLDEPAHALAYGVLIGGFGQVLIQVPQLLRLGYRPKFRLSLWHPGLTQILKLFGPIVVGLSAGRVNILVSTLLASFLVEGTMSYLNYSFRLMHFPLGVFAIALGTVSLPRASELVATGQMETLSKTFVRALNMNMLLIIPSAVFLGLMAPEIVTLIYKWGRFTDTDMIGTSRTLLHYSYGLIGMAAVRVTAPVYYALGDAKTPMNVSIAAIGMNIALYFPLMAGFNYAGLAAATSIASLANFVGLLVLLPPKGVPLPWQRLVLEWTKIAIAAAVAFYTAKMLPIDFTQALSLVAGRLLNVFVPALLAVIIFAGLCLLLRSESFSAILERLRSKR